MFDEIIARYFEDEEAFHTAMRLLSRHDEEAVGDWKTSVEPFLMSLNEWESHSLEKAISYRIERDRRSVQRSSPADSERLERVEQTLQLLTERHTPLSSKALSELVELYMSERQSSWSEKHRENNTRDLQPKIQLLVDVLDDKPGNDLAPGDIVTFKEALFKLPSNRKKGIYAGKSINELLAMDELLIKNMGASTIKNYATKVASFLQWLAKNNFSIAGLESPLQGIRKPNISDHELRPIFTPEELKQLFESRQYTQGRHKQPAHYWVPLLALFTGARQAELCQLYKEDVYKDPKTGIWIIDINEKKDKKIKKGNHSRIVPIHKTLIQMKFLDYVANVDHERIFPDQKMKRGGYGQELSKWFCRTYLNKNNCDVRKENDDPDAVFHSFRHTMETQLDHDHGIPPHHVAHLVGQKPPGGSVTTNRYIKPLDIRANQKIINKLSYPSVDFYKIASWKRGYKPHTEK